MTTPCGAPGFFLRGAMTLLSTSIARKPHASKFCNFTGSYGENAMTEHKRKGIAYVPEPLRCHVEAHFTRRQMAAAYGCDPETISRWVEHGQLPKPVRYGARDVWTLESLDEHRRQRAIKAQEESGPVRPLKPVSPIAKRAR